MRRFLFITAVASAVFSALGFFVGTSFSALVISPLIILTLLILAVFKRHFRIFAAAAMIALAFFSYSSLVYSYEVVPVRRLGGVQASVTGYICDEPEFDGTKAVYPVKTDSVSVKGAPQKIKLKLISKTADDFKVGDGVNAAVSFYELDSAYRKSNYSEGVFIGAYAVSVAKDTESSHRGPYNFAVALRQKMRFKIGKLYNGDRRGFLIALLLGDRNYMSDRALGNFKTCGITHLIAISGLHLGIIIGALDVVLKRLLKSRFLRFSLVAFAVFTLMAVTGFSPSVIRAGVMYLFVLSGEVFFRSGDRLNVLGAAAIIMLAFNPFLWASAAFVLSFLSVIGIIVFSDIIERFILSGIDKIGVRIRNKNLRNGLLAMLDSVSVSLAASAATMPALFIMFGGFSALGVIATLLTISFASPILILLIISLILDFSVFAPIEYVLRKIVSLLSGYVLWVTEKLAKLSLFQISASETVAGVFVFSALSILGSAAIAVNFGVSQKGLRHCASIAAVSLLSVILLSPVLIPASYKITMPSTPDGFSAIVSYKNTAVVIGCGDDKSDFGSINREISRLGVDSVDAVVLLDGCGDCRENAQKIANKYGCTEIYGDDEGKSETVSDEIFKMDFGFSKNAEIFSICNNFGFAVQMNIKALKVIFCSGKYHLPQNRRFDLALVTPAVSGYWETHSAMTVISAAGNDEGTAVPLFADPVSSKLYFVQGPAQVTINKRNKIRVYTR